MVHRIDTSVRVVGAIDVGTNTTNFLVARVEEGAPTPLASASVMTALGEGLGRTGRIAPEGLDLVAETTAAMAAEARQLGADALVIACTAVGRNAANAGDLVERIEAATGVRPTILSGTDEARLSFAGRGAGGAPDPLLAADLGGGSMELMGGEGGELRWATSLPVGVRSLTEEFAPGDPPSLDAVGPIVARCRELVAPVARAHPSDGCVAVGGSARALAAIAGTDRLDRAALLSVVETLAAAPAEDLAQEHDLEAARLRLCTAGAAALEAVRREFGLEALQVSAAGLREGLVMEAVR
jgi:exopolyphosphatase/guanosine-5'-triphosphate,3'-diphosphate pyrophosphatase